MGIFEGEMKKESSGRPYKILEELERDLDAKERAIKDADYW